MNNSKKNKMIAASVAGLLAMGTLAVVSAQAEMPGTAGVACYGVNACKGTGECGGKGNACAGKNACKGAGWVKAETAEACTTQGGTLTAKAE